MQRNKSKYVFILHQKTRQFIKSIRQSLCRIHSLKFGLLTRLLLVSVKVGFESHHHNYHAIDYDVSIHSYRTVEKLVWDLKKNGFLFACALIVSSVAVVKRQNLFKEETKQQQKPATIGFTS